MDFSPWWKIGEANTKTKNSFFFLPHSLPKIHPWVRDMRASPPLLAMISPILANKEGRIADTEQV